MKQNPKLSDNAQQKLQLVDQQGNLMGKTIARYKAHTTPGKKHLALQVLVINSKNECILHKRKSKKIGGNTLDAPTTHILPLETRDEAAWRCLENEYDIREKMPLVQLSGFSYEYDYGDGTCENEFCLVSLAKFDGKIQPNEKEMHGKPIIKPLTTIIKELKKQPNEYPIWFHKTIKLFLESPESKKFY